MRIYALKQDETSSTTQAKLARTFKPHSTPVITTTTDASGTLLAVGSADGAIKIYDIERGFVTHTFRGSSGVVSALHFFEITARSNYQKKSRDKYKHRGHETEDEDEDTDSAGKGEIQTSALHLASGGEDGKIRIWSLAQRKSVAVLDSHLSVVRDLDFSSVQNTLLSGGRDKTAILWDASTWRVKRIIPILETVEACGFFGTQYLYTGGERGALRVWNTHTGSEVTREQAAGVESDAMLQIVHNQERGFLLCVHTDQSLILHSTAPVSPKGSSGLIDPLPTVRHISGTHDEIIDFAYLMPERSMLALATNSESIRIINVQSSSQTQCLAPTATGRYFGADVASLSGHTDIVICLSVDWSGRWLATGSKDNTARIWYIDATNDSFECIATLSGHTESVGAVCLPSHPPSNTLQLENQLQSVPPFLLTGSQDRTIKRWDISKISSNTSVAPRTLFTRKAHDKDINAIALSSIASLFATASQDKTIKIYSLEEGEVQGILRGHKRGVWSVAFSPRGTPSLGSSDGNPSSSGKGYLLSGSGDKTLKIWSLTDYTCLRTVEGHTNSVLKVLWLPLPSQDEDTRQRSAGSGPQIASSAGDGLVKIWDALSGEVATTLDNHTDRVWALAVRPMPFSPSFNTKSVSSPKPESRQAEPMLLLSGGADATLTFWRDTTFRTLATRNEQKTQRVEQEQQLANLIHGNHYREAITLALQLNYPGRLLSLLQAVFTPTDFTISNEGAADAQVAKERENKKKEVEDVIATLSPSQLLLLLQRVRDWNTNARTCGLAQRVLDVVLRRYSLQRLVSMANAKPSHSSVALINGESENTSVGKAAGVRSSKGGGWKEVIEALKVYTERHYKRVEEVGEEAWVVEWMWREMNGGMRDVAVAGGRGGDEMMEDVVNGHGYANGMNGVNGGRDEEEDVVMV